MVMDSDKSQGLQGESASWRTRRAGHSSVKAQSLRAQDELLFQFKSEAGKKEKPVLQLKFRQAARKKSLLLKAGPAFWFNSGLQLTG